MIAGDKLETVEVLVNEPHDLECEVSGTEPMDIEWQRGGQTIDFGGIRGGSSYMQVSVAMLFFIESSATGDDMRLKIRCSSRKNTVSKSRLILRDKLEHPIKKIVTHVIDISKY